MHAKRGLVSVLRCRAQSNWLLNKNKPTLKIINAKAWSQLYTTRSYPFPEPETGRIAVKVINHYGDEVLEVYEVD